MKLNTLVMSRNQSCLRVLAAAFAELGIEYRISLSAPETIELLGAGHHSALVVDFDLPHTVEVAKIARTAFTKRKPVLFGMIGAENPVGGVFQAGANFVLYKPLELSQVLHSLRAAQGFMQADRRRSCRQKNETLAYLEFPSGTLRRVSLRFLLPGTTTVVHATGDFIWTDQTGRAGLFFSSIPAASRRDLQTWLTKHGVKKSDAVKSLLEPHKSRRVLQAAH